VTAAHEPASSDDFNFDWEALTFSARPAGDPAWLATDDWEERFARDTTGYLSDPLTTSFTDLDLSGIQTTLREFGGSFDFDETP
jgi:hypothetical protein